jgi:hypothetical protein
MEIGNNIHTIYEPLKHAIIQQIKIRLQLQIISIEIIVQMESFQENPPDALTYKTVPTQAHKIAMEIRIYAQEWLTPMPRNSRIILT